MNFLVSARKLSHKGCILFAGLESQIALEAASGANDAFLSVKNGSPGSRLIFNLGLVPELHRFTLCHRYEPYWMKPKAGSRIQDVPAETQFLLAELVNGHWLLCVPLLDEPFRFSLRGRDDNQLELLAETGDPYTVGQGGVALYIACGSDPFDLVSNGAHCVADRLHSGRLRKDKTVPDFADTFGWCTWDAFYRDVSAESIRSGLEHFAAGGISPRFVILDDGWQSVERQPTTEERMVAFEPNGKFGGQLSPTVTMAKTEFGVSTFLVWHSIVGYWGGVSNHRLPGYAVTDKIRRFGEGIMAHVPSFNEQWWGSLVGFVAPERVAEFYEDFHSYLASQGVDGVKVDSQAVLEAISADNGGRVRVTQTYRRALERSVQKHFKGRLINCMSNAQETLYGSPLSTLLRSSIDFFPQLPASHGLHLYTNAQVGLWFGEFMQPDWDMFQSGHAWGAYHAAGRAISGGPVYVSDKPGAHDFELLRKLVCTDGTVLRCDLPAVPTFDTLCVDPTIEEALLKIWNRNGSAGILGIFNGKGGAEGQPGSRLTAAYKPADIRNLIGDRFACFSHVAGTLELLGTTEEQVIALGPREFELVTIAPVDKGFAPIGLADKFNSAGALSAIRWISDTRCEITLKDAGRFLAYSEKRPVSAQINDVDGTFEWNDANGALRINLTFAGINRVQVTWSSAEPSPLPPN